jgi:hypothetical protein
MADGHVDALKPDQARDMRRWANRADRADYNFTPP